jgi:prevent-host-death family protein
MFTHTVNIHEAKTHFSRLIEEVSHGKEVIIGKAGKPVAKLVPFKLSQTPRQPGYWRGKVIIKKDFDKLPKQLLAAFKGEKN